MKKVFIITQLESKYDVGVVLQLAKLAQNLAKDITVVITFAADNLLVQSLAKSGVVNEVMQLELSQHENPTTKICSIIKGTDFILLASSGLYAQCILPSCVANLNCPYVENVNKLTDRIYSIVNEKGLRASCDYPEESYAMTVISDYCPALVSGSIIKDSCNLAQVADISNGASDTILVGGLGLGSKENFARLVKLGKLMNADVGATAGAVVAGYAPDDFLVGVSGKDAAGKVYIGFGVSGAISHTLSLSKAKTIVAINNDNNAAILAVADYAVIIDVMVAIEYFEKILVDGSPINGVNKCI